MDKWLENNFDGMLSDIIGLLQIPSVKGEPAPHAPFGVEVARALEYTLNIAEKLGFRTVNNDGYYGYAETGEGELLLGILTHLDVVPEGSGWTYPPYGAEIHDGKIYARGAIDDKAPAVAALYALKAAVEKGLKGKVRIIFGCDEESGWGCMNKYVEEEEAPKFAFSPDADYPLINTEKRILHLMLKAQFDNEFNITIHGGQRANVVPDRATVKVADEGLRTELIKAGGTDEGEIIFSGVNAHGSMPEMGVNALFPVIKALSNATGETGQLFTTVANALAHKVNGEGMGIDISDEQSGRMTVNMGIMDVEDNNASVVLDLRIPVTVDYEMVIEKIKSTFVGFEVEILAHQPAHHVSADSKEVQTLLAVYSEVTGLPAGTRAIGGGTYARAFDNAVAFGPQLPGREDLAHQKDEYIIIEDILINARIYAHSIARLMA